MISDGSQLEIDFSYLPHNVSQIKYNINVDNSVIQFGSIACVNKSCIMILNTSFSLKNQFTMDILGLQTEFSVPYNAEFTLRFYSLTGRKSLSQAFPISRINNDYSANTDSINVGSSTTLNIMFNNWNLNSSAYELTILFGNFATINRAFLCGVYINNVKISYNNLIINNINNTLTLSNFLLDKNKICKITIRGLYIGPFS